MKRNKANIILRELLKLESRTIIMVTIAMGIALILSKFINMRFRTILEYTAILILFIGAISVIGGRSAFMDHNYNLTKLTIGGKDSTKKDIELMFQSYRFCVFMGITGIILLLISIVV